MSSNTSAVFPSKAKSFTCGCGVAKIVSRLIALPSQSDDVNEPTDALAVAFVGVLQRAGTFFVDRGPSLEVGRRHALRGDELDEVMDHGVLILRVEFGETSQDAVVVDDEHDPAWEERA